MSADLQQAQVQSGARSGPRISVLRALSPAGSRARLLILTFHRVLEQPDPWLADEPDAAAFAQQMDWVAEFCRVLPLPEAAARLSRGDLPDRAACITFDDGYANNLEVALPILRQRGLAATVFVAVDAVKRGIMWNDLVIEALRRAPPHLDLSPMGLGTFTLHDDANRSAAVNHVLSHLKYLPLAKRWESAEELYQRCANQPSPRLMMTPEQVRQMGEAGVDIGGHTVNHPILANLSDEEARREIEGCWAWVREIVGRAPQSFAYPNGRPNVDYTAKTAAMVRDAGFSLAVTTQWGCANRAANAFELPRIAPWDRSPLRFWARLAQTYVQSYRRNAPRVAHEC